MRCVNSSFPGLDVDGGFAELMVTRERNLVSCPEGLEPADVAPHADAGLTAYRAVKRARDVLQPGTVAVVIGVGGLGHVAVQLLKVMTAARCVVVEKSPVALQLAQALGADVSFSASKDVVGEVMEVTHGIGADVVFDFVGEDESPATGVAMTRAGGQYYVVGYGGQISVPAIEMISMEKSILGSQVGTFTELQELMQLVASGRLSLRIQRYSLSDVNQAIRDLANGKIVGRAVLVP
jgi:NAD+-dependent secondary alcohol dehydrogenase Adh1